MDEKEVKKIVADVLKGFGCSKYSFERSGGKTDVAITVTFSLEKDVAEAVHEKLGDGYNFYGFGWHLGPLTMRETDEYKIELKKV